MPQTRAQRATQLASRKLQENLALLKSHRDHVRIELHLGGMEARDRWKKLEPRLERAERAVHEAGAAIEDVVDAVKRFRDTLRRGR